MRVADYIGRFLKALDVPVFAVTGGGSIYLTDGMHCAGVKLIFCHHEQACAMAAEGYAKTSGKLGVCCVTTGCGGTNAITGVLSAWQDSAPVMVLSGQVWSSETIEASKLPLRQFGVQEADIMPMVRPITKLAVRLENPDSIAYDLGMAHAIAIRARRGPVWLDVPLDVQNAEVDADTLKRYEDRHSAHEPLREQVEQVRALLAAAKRPVVVAGQGVRLARACGELIYFLKAHPMPVVQTWLGTDVLPSDFPQNYGRIGRDCDAANALVREADLVLAIGSRLSLASTVYHPENFAPQAKVIAVDVDPNEHLKRCVKVDMFVQADAGEFLRAMGTADDAAVVRRCW